MSHFGKQRLAMLAFVVLVSLAGCGGSKLWDITQNPDKYKGKTVTVTGTVDKVMGDIYRTEPVYTINDGKGMLMILGKAREALPAPKKKITITGVLETKYMVGGKEVEIILVEK